MSRYIWRVKKMLRKSLWVPLSPRPYFGSFSEPWLWYAWGSWIWFRKCQMLTDKLTGQGELISSPCLVFLNMISLRLSHYKYLSGGQGGGVEEWFKGKIQEKTVLTFLVAIVFHPSTIRQGVNYSVGVLNSSSLSKPSLQNSFTSLPLSFSSLQLSCSLAGLNRRA